jgi:uncharacterized protein (TIGR03067 family)
MRITALLTLTIAMLAPSISQADEKSELKKLQGKYDIVTLKSGGKSAPPEVLKSKMHIENNQLIIVRIADGKEKKSPITAKLDDTKSPKHITLIRNGTPRYEGIYKLEKGKLTICYNRTGKGRPTKFESTEDTKTMLMVLKRIAVK